MTVEAHVDEIADDQTTEIAQTQLAGDLLRRLDICLEGGLLFILDIARPAAVYVDRYHGFSLIDHNATAALQRHVSGMDSFQLILDPVMVEDRNPAVIFLDDVFRRPRQCDSQEFPNVMFRFRRIDDYAIEVGSEYVAYGPSHKIGFAV